ncbi:amidase family protein [Alkalilimnicola ehrlichii]|nr:amidase family protein [Alkalilimnicola ehrlichii]
MRLENGFLDLDPLHLPATGSGPLSGLRFAVKDVIDVAGTVTGLGHPLWRSTHAPAASNADCVVRLLAAGAELIGKTHTDELTYSLSGQNAHYGMPPNPAVPNAVPGGSSSGSASVTAAGLVDFAIGTDTGGSVRVPASFCGIYGLRPTHGAVDNRGVAQLAHSFDTVGWFARDARILRAVGHVLLPPSHGLRLQRVRMIREASIVVAPELSVQAEQWLATPGFPLICEKQQPPWGF